MAKVSTYAWNSIVHLQHPYGSDAVTSFCNHHHQPTSSYVLGCHADAVINPRYSVITR
jgi:hypothetical protein